MKILTNAPNLCHNLIMDEPIPNQKVAFKDTVGHRRWRFWIICPVCHEGRWVRDDCHYRKHFSEMCLKCFCRTRHSGKKRENGYRWRGGRFKGSQGYFYISVPKDDFFYPMMTKAGYIQEHRLVMARHLNRHLLPWEVVHHKNGIKDDNRLENLELLSSRSHHANDTVLKALVKTQALMIERLNKRISELENKCGRVVQRKQA